MFAMFVFVAILTALFPVGVLMVWGLHRWAGGKQSLWQFIRTL